MIDPRLTTLLTLTKVKNYTKTAQRLFITQPAVTHHIKSIEKEYDIQIFANNKTFELTNEGQIMLEYARSMQNQSTQLSGALEKSRNTSKRLAMSMTNSASTVCLKKGLLDLLFKFFNSSCDITVNSLENIFKNLQEGIIDFAIIDSNYDDDIFEGLVLDSLQVVPVCYKEGKFKEIRRVTREMLKSNSVILGSKEEGIGTTTLDILKKVNVRLNRNNVIMTNSSLILAQCVEAKDGIGFIYSDLLDTFSSLKKMDLLNFNLNQNIYFIYNHNSFDKKLLKDIVVALKKWKGANK